MTKRIIKYFLLISITLLIGYGQLFAEANSDTSVFSLNNKYNKGEACNLVKEYNNLSFNFDYVHPLFDVNSLKIQGIDIEIEENEVTSSKKQIAFVNYFTTSIYQNLNSDLRVNSRKIAVFSNSLSKFSFNKLFIIFNVFRI